MNSEFAVPAPKTKGTAKTVDDTKVVDCPPERWKDFFSSCSMVQPAKSPNRFRVFTGGAGSTLCVLLHGGGHSAMSWACCAKALSPSYRVMAMDLRGHGGSVCVDEDDWSTDTMVTDVVAVLKEMYTSVPQIMLVGHSMGGALAVHMAVAAKSKGLNVVGLCVVDVVEGTAVQALEHMERVVQSVPKSFDSVDKAVKWSLSSGELRNPVSASVSIPARLRKDAKGRWRWRADVVGSKTHWKGWFDGLSSLFLSVRAMKLLVLAGTDRLDTQLTVAQMQGKYQLCMLYRTGHIIQEDAPEELAKVLVKFGRRYGFCKDVLVVSPTTLQDSCS